MIPDTESACQTPAMTYQCPEVYDKFKSETSGPENEAASVTAWKRYQHFLAIMKSRGEKFNRKSMIESMFRGGDLVYLNQ
ncbi:uncharacterized protein LOC127284225 [Leptopilina boulardi]|uniref:uncharacterized protein LOC127284225 n=1 Tax=Leptopilina boulardi TaxID=63433 RepID=UPI0021F69BC4|nr:uncharacterized protein LOC127284225 [Leptopilina boulardi]